MMVFNVYSVFDEKALVFAPPFLMVHDGEALRAFGDAVGDPKSKLAAHPGDFKLFRLGTFNDVTGKMESLDMPLPLAPASDFVKKPAMV